MNLKSIPAQQRYTLIASALLNCELYRSAEKTKILTHAKITCPSNYFSSDDEEACFLLSTQLFLHPRFELKKHSSTTEIYFNSKCTIKLRALSKRRKDKNPHSRQNNLPPAQAITYPQMMKKLAFCYRRSYFCILALNLKSIPAQQRYTLIASALLNCELYRSAEKTKILTHAKITCPSNYLSSDDEEACFLLSTQLFLHPRFQSEKLTATTNATKNETT